MSWVYETIDQLIMSAPRMSEGDWGPVKGTVLQLRRDGKSLPHILRVISKPTFHPR